MGKPLLDVLRELSLDPDKQAAFADDPSRYLAQYGYEDVAADDLDEAFSLVADTLPPDVAQSVAPPATATALADQDDGSGGAPDATINPDEEAFGGVDESFDTATFNGSEDGSSDEDGFETDAPDADDGDLADGNGGYGTGELSLVDLADGPEATETVAFGVGSDGADGGNGADTVLADDLVGEDGAPFLDGEAETFEIDDLDETRRRGRRRRRPVRRADRRGVRRRTRGRRGTGRRHQLRRRRLVLTAPSRTPTSPPQSTTGPELQLRACSRGTPPWSGGLLSSQLGGSPRRCAHPLRDRPGVRG